MNNVLANVTGWNVPLCFRAAEESPDSQHLCLIHRTQASVYKDPNKGFIYV